MSNALTGKIIAASKLRRLSAMLVLITASLNSACQDETVATTSPEASPFVATVLLENLDQPWALAFLPQGGLLITQKTGQLILAEGSSRRVVSGVPEIASVGQGGLLDVALHPEFTSNPKQRWVYLSYSEGDEGRYGTALGRGRLQRGSDGSASLSDWQVLFSLPAKTSKTQHFGSRIAFDKDGDLYLSVGDRGERTRAQSLSDPAGSILRFHADGSIPQDNPFRDQPGAHPAIFSTGHRNPQGLTRHPKTGEIWETEHGPQGGDEVNRIHAGLNYGWPVITYGEEYGTGFSIGEGTEKPGIEQPLHYWKPSIAPSGMSFYQGEAFPQWQGDLLVGALKKQRLVRLQIQDGRIIAEHRYIAGLEARIRDVRVGPDGLIYVLTDARNGKLIRLSPKELAEE